MFRQPVLQLAANYTHLCCQSNALPCVSGTGGQCGGGYGATQSRGGNRGCTSSAPGDSGVYYFGGRGAQNDGGSGGGGYVSRVELALDLCEVASSALLASSAACVRVALVYDATRSRHGAPVKTMCVCVHLCVCARACVWACFSMVAAVPDTTRAAEVAVASQATTVVASLRIASTTTSSCQICVLVRLRQPTSATMAP